MTRMPHERADKPRHRHYATHNTSHLQKALPIPGTPRMVGNHKLQMSTPNSPRFLNGSKIPTATDSEAPRPIGVDPSVTGSFARLSKGEGARLTTRDNAEQRRRTSSATLHNNKHLRGKARPRVKSHEVRMQVNRRLFIGIAIAVAVVITIGAFFFNSLLNNSTQQTDNSTQIDQTQVAPDQSITYNDDVYTLTTQDDGSYALSVQTQDSDQQRAIFTLDGTPVQLVLYNGAFIIPENLDGSWDIIAYTVADGSVPAQVTGTNGNPITGEGSITSVQLDGATLRITDENSSVTEVALDQ